MMNVRDQKYGGAEGTQTTLHERQERGTPVILGMFPNMHQDASLETSEQSATVAIHITANDEHPMQLRKIQPGGPNSE